MRMTINELDREELKELRGKLLDRKKAQARLEREQVRIRADEEARMLFAGRRGTEQTVEFEFER